MATIVEDCDLRNGLQEDDFDEHYLVLGKFGDDKNDQGVLPGTRWVAKRELCEFCDESNLELLSAWERARGQPPNSRRRRGDRLRLNETKKRTGFRLAMNYICLLYTSPSPRDRQKSRMPSSA